MLSGPLNRAFAAIFGGERFLIGRVELPVWLSLLAVAEQKNSGAGQGVI